MTISPFATQQTDVFVPALGLLAVAALFAVLPIVFAPALHRHRGGRLMTGLFALVAAAMLVLTGVQAGAGFRVIAAERDRVQAQIAQQYGLHLSVAQVGTLLDGGGLELKPKYGKKGVRFRKEAHSTDDYRLVYGTGATAVPLPARS